MTTSFLETVRDEFNRMRARSFAGDGYEGVTHAGLCIVARDTGWVLLAQRSYDPTDDPEVRESWEFPGGGLNDGEEPFPAAQREFYEEVGFSLPAGDVVSGWRSPAGNYQLFIYVIDTAFDASAFAPTEEVQAVAWVPPLPGRIARDMKLRPEMDDFDWTLAEQAVSGNEEMDMTQQAVDPDEAMEDPAEEATETPAEEAAEEMDEPDYSDCSCFAPSHIMIHGVLAPEATPSGDQRGFTAGAVTSRPLRLPIGWQINVASGHDGAITVGSIDRMARKGGLIYWEGALMSSETADDFVDLLMFFERYGLSIDGVKGNVDQQQSKADGMLWFDAVQVAGATACAVPAFAEAYIALGPSPDMPAPDAAPDVMAASGFTTADVAGSRREEFNRGPGWVTDPKATNRIHDYWTKPGQPGYEKIGWGKPGDFARAKALIGEKIAKHSPSKMRFLNQIIAQWHHDALGYWPATHAKMDRAGVKAAAEVSGNEEAADGWTITTDDEGEGWEAVLVSSAAGGRALPPSSYFERHPDTGALVIEEPDEFGLRRTYGYAGEWGVCHIGHDGRCVEVPEDPDGGEFNSFHLGRTKTSDAGYINTGLITYKVDHRDAQTILSETAEQQHFDNIAHAWAQVRLGMDDRGIWFAGVVLPGIPEDDLVVIEAAGQVSGEWKYGNLRALQAVNVPGFPVLRSSAAYDDEGNVVALVASMTGTSECEPSAFERMQALARADAEARFAALRREFNWTDVAEELVAEAEAEGRVEPVGVRDDGAIVYEKDGEVPGTDTIAEPLGEGD